eukprot:gene10617-3240_t
MDSPGTPLLQCSVCGFAICMICTVPVLVFISLTIYYSVAYNTFIKTECTATSNATVLVIRTCGYYGCYPVNYYSWSVDFLTTEKKNIATRTEFILNPIINKNDTFTCWYAKFSPQSGVAFYNYYFAPFLVFLILVCVLGGICCLYCIISSIIFPIGIIIDQRNELESSIEKEKKSQPSIPENK